ncbi:MAG TPA: hypothetical protein VMW73_16355 [Spirochaetia bacterium]|nr:hypothetical protein [Spirochaetia bacterium]
MRARSVRAAALPAALLLAFASAHLFADSTASQTSPNSVTTASPTTAAPGTTTTPAATTTPTLQPVPYGPNEFPLWAQDLRRAEVVTVGVFPFALVYTGLIYNLGRYVSLAVSGDPLAPNYLPWNNPPLSENEKVGIVLGSIGVAVVVGIIDFAINSSERRAAEERRQAQEAAAKAAGLQSADPAATQPGSAAPATVAPAHGPGL